MSENYDRLKAQKDRILAKQKERERQEWCINMAKQEGDASIGVGAAPMKDDLTDLLSWLRSPFHIARSYIVQEQQVKVVAERHAQAADALEAARAENVRLTAAIKIARGITGYAEREDLAADAALCAADSILRKALEQDQ